MSTIVANEFELIMHLDFNFEEPCDVENPPCEAAATWKVLLTCCDNPYLLCDEHYDALLLVARISSASIRCNACRNVGIKIRLAERIKS